MSSALLGRFTTHECNVPLSFCTAFVVPRRPACSRTLVSPSQSPTPHAWLNLAIRIPLTPVYSMPRPHFDYLPLDEDHSRYPHDAYSLCKVAVEEQAKAFCRRYPKMRIACLRPHWVIPESLAYDPVALDEAEGNWKDLWGWTSVTATARAFVAGVTAPEDKFPLGAEAFFIVAPTITQQRSSLELLKKWYPEAGEGKIEMRREWKGNEGFFDCSKAERMLGWTEKAFPWTPK